MSKDKSPKLSESNSKSPKISLPSELDESSLKIGELSNSLKLELAKKKQNEIIKELDRVSGLTITLNRSLSKINTEIERLNKSIEKDNEKLRKKLIETTSKLEKHEETIKSIAISATKSVLPNSCIYLFKLGSCDKLDTIFPYDEIYKNDKHCIYKFGLTNDIERREKEHTTNFKNKLGCVDFEQIFTQPSSILCNRDNENRVKSFFQENKYTFISTDLKLKKVYNELVILPNKDLKKVINFLKKL